MKLNFAKISPTRNMTVIVTDPVPRKDHARIAGQLMAYGSVGAEQVGFREEAGLPGARVRLQMMGGEFCGNASMSMAALLAFEDGLPEDSSEVYPLEVSGAEGIVSCRISRRGDVFTGTVEMPPARRIGMVDGYPAVFLDGIVHAIVPEGEMSPAEAEEKIAGWCDLLKEDAMGILLVNEAVNAFRPLVYVRGTGSAVWENGCGSGTAAIGAYAAAQRGGSVSLALEQPGGTMQVHVECGTGGAQRIEITGEVRIAAIGMAWVEG